MPRRYYAYALLILGLAVWDYRQLALIQAPDARGDHLPPAALTPRVPGSTQNALPHVIRPNGALAVPDIATPDLPSHSEADAAVAEITRFPNTTVIYYDVRGSTRREIARAMRAGQPADMGGRGRYYAYTHWHFDWQWPSDGHGGCDLQNAFVVFSADVTLPRLVMGEDIDPDVLDAWHSFMASLIRHEAGHVRHAFEHSEDVAAAIRASRCETANQAALDAVRTLGAYDAEYDTATRHGAAQGATFP